MDESTARRLHVRNRTVEMAVGGGIRDWTGSGFPLIIYPYTHIGGLPIAEAEYVVSRYLWRFRRTLQTRRVFSKTLMEMGRPWWEHLEHYREASKPLVDNVCICNNSQSLCS